PSTFRTGTHLLWVGDERANELPLLFAEVHLNGRSHQRSRVDPLDPVMKCALSQTPFARTDATSIRPCHPVARERRAAPARRRLCRRGDASPLPASPAC